jgi:ligand-binding sensor domain-containing protein
MRKIFFILALLILCNYTYSQNWSLNVINTSNSQIPSNNVRSLALDNKKQLWAGTTNGIGKFSNNIWTRLLVNNLYDEILNIWITGDSLWIGTEYDGLWRFSDNRWTHYDPNSFGNGILGFAVGDNDTIFRLDKFGEFDKWSGNSWTELISYVSHAQFLFSDSKKNIWIGSGNVGLYKYYNGILFQFKNYIIDTTSNEYIPAYDLKCMVEDSETNLWIGTGDKGLLKYNGTNWEVISVPSNAKVLDLAIDKNNKIWLATDKGIMCYFNGEWLIFNTLNSSLPDDRIVSIKLENENKLWAAVGYNNLYSPPGGKGIVCLTNDLNGIETNSTQDYRIYPNPATSSFKFKSNVVVPHGATVEIYNLFGRKINVVTVPEGQTEIEVDVKGWSHGLYFVRLLIDGRFAGNGRVIVQ